MTIQQSSALFLNPLAPTCARLACPIRKPPRAAARKLPLIIANPDVVTVSGASLLPMPGQLGLWYKEIDATLPVRIMGKPDAGIYEARSLLRVLAWLFSCFT